MCWNWLISGEPTEDETGRLKTFHGHERFQVGMMGAPCASCSSFVWFCGQCIPITAGCTQCLLRRKILNGDMTKYSCFQGYFNFCCFAAGNCGEQNCPNFCAFMEGCFCNCIAVSASRTYMMDQYDLSSDPCDYRLIRINNCLQLLSCFCNILAIFVREVRSLARVIDRIADLFYQCVSGCMTAQTAHEADYRLALHGQPGGVGSARALDQTHGAGTYQAPVVAQPVDPSAPPKPN